MRRLLAYLFLAMIAVFPIRAQPSQILVPGQSWTLLGQGYQLTADSAVNKDGTVYFSDAHNNRIMKIDLEGRITTWKEESHGTHGVAFGPDGLLYALELSDNAGFPSPGNGKLVRLTRAGTFEDVVTGLNVPGGMTWGPDGRVYISDFSAVPAPHLGVGRILRFDVAYGF